MAFARVFTNGIPEDDWVKLPKGWKKVYKGRLRKGDKVLHILHFCETGKAKFAKIRDAEDKRLMATDVYLAIRKIK